MCFAAHYLLDESKSMRTLDIGIRYCTVTADSKMIFTCRIFLMGVFILIMAKGFHCLGRGSNHINVLISERNPFFILEKTGSPRDLDVSIIENFAVKFNLQINYIFINSSLNSVVANEDHFNEFSSQIESK